MLNECPLSAVLLITGIIVTLPACFHIPLYKTYAPLKSFSHQKLWKNSQIGTIIISNFYVQEQGRRLSEFRIQQSVGKIKRGIERVRRFIKKQNR